MKRLASCSVLALLAVLAVFAQLDRASARYPTLALAIPAPLRSVSQVPIVALALAGSDPQRARAEAARLVRRRPIPAEHLFLFALAELRVDRPEAFAAAFELSTERGWRARPVQVVAARAALDAGDVEAAANRIAALWALGPDAETFALTDRLLALDGGRAAFEQRAVSTNIWTEEADQFLAADRAPSR